MVVCEEDHGVDELRQRPAVFFSLEKALENKTGDGGEPAKPFDFRFIDR